MYKLIRFVSEMSIQGIYIKGKKKFHRTPKAEKFLHTIITVLFIFPAL